ncbi:MAG: TPM domain-containing protein [Saprospiraceae bacterium]|nr:TPM domain-containing protein [Saprospiraceae bacterium]
MKNTPGLMHWHQISRKDIISFITSLGTIRQKSTLVLFLLLNLLFSSPLLSQREFTIQDVPDPKRSGGGYVSDPTNIISFEARQTLNQIISQLEGNSTAQMAVVVLPSIGQQVPKSFATELFNTWGIGQASVDNGLLLLVVMDQRRSEIETGYGLEAVLPDVICYRVLLDELVPQFQRQAYGEGLIRTVSRLKTLLEDPAALEEIRAAERGPELKHLFGYRVHPVLYWYIIAAVLFHIGIAAWIMITLGNKEDLYDKYRHVRYVQGIFFMVIFPLPYIFFYFIIRRISRKLRDQPRFSKLNGKPMRKLTEEEEDDYLEKGQITEEALGVVDYDVWVTEDLDDVMILRYANRFSAYSKCPECKYQTYHLAQTQTLRRASYSHSGKEKQIYECKNCDYIHSKVVIIPKKTRSSSSSGGGGGGGWGGGSSGGGGGGASW